MELPSIIFQNTNVLQRQHNSKTRPNFFYLKTNSYIGLTCFKGTETRLYPCRPQSVRYPLPFKIIYTYNVDLWLQTHSVIFKQHNIGVYDFKW